MIFSLIPSEGQLRALLLFFSVRMFEKLLAIIGKERENNDLIKNIREISIEFCAFLSHSNQHTKKPKYPVQGFRQSLAY